MIRIMASSINAFHGQTLKDRTSDLKSNYVEQRIRNWASVIHGKAKGTHKPECEGRSILLQMAVIR